MVVVGRVRLPRQGVVLAAHLRRRHPLLLLPPVAEPDPDDLLLQLEVVGEDADLLGAGLWRLEEVLLQGALDAYLDKEGC